MPGPPAAPGTARSADHVPFPGMSVFFVSREPVRAPQPLADFAEVAKRIEEALGASELVGSLSVPSQDRFVVAACPRGLGNAAESSMVEVYEYDPVRYQTLVIGLVEPPGDTPVHWMCRRVNPDARVVAVIDAPQKGEGTVDSVEAPRGYLGNTDTLLAFGRLLKGKRALVVQGTGLVCWGATVPEFVQTVVAAFSTPEGGPAQGRRA